ncbi:MAG TPA: CAP domain-containing protein [Bacilli bacterium]|nr:CAP domain-containing protein [Bacilli bacterium]
MKKWLLGTLSSLLLATTVILPSVTDNAEAASTTTYTVQRGDSLWKIAQKYQTGVSEIIGANRLPNPNLIYPGQKLTIPLLDPKVASFQTRVVNLTNNERAKNGLKPLKMNWELQRVARFKAEDMRNRNYFDHTSPTYGSPFTMIKNFGIHFTSAGENIAAGQQSPEAVVAAWMKSPGHRANILNATYTEIGCGTAIGGNYSYYWTQEFIRR